MKKRILLLISLLFLSLPLTSYSQAQEIQQLLLNLEKLAQFKDILKDMKKGYDILSRGYKGVKDMTEGNFNLHKTFIDALMQVSPVVKNYKRVGDIIYYQITLIKESKKALFVFSKSKNFTASEMQYFERVYENLTNESLRNLEDLTTILSANKLRMSDDERLMAIDKIYIEMQEKVQFLRSFNSSTSILTMQRSKEGNDINVLKKIHSIKD